MNKLAGLIIVILMVTALSMGDALGRGFGGFRGGGFGGARFGGGSGGDRFGGDFHGAGFGADRFQGNFGGDRFGGDRFRGDRFSDNRVNAGFDRARFGGERFRGGFDRDRFNAGSRQRFDHPDAMRDRRGVGGVSDRDFRGASRTNLDKFLGMPTDAGVTHVGATHVGADGITHVGATRVDAGPARVGATHITAGRIAGPRGGSAAFVSRTHVGFVTPAARRTQAVAVRGALYGHKNLFTPAWYRTHARAWTAAGITASAWTAATWSGVVDWLGCDSTPENYDYGDTVTYQGGNVYEQGAPAGSAQDYYNQANELAASGSAQQSDKSQWMSLGVFAMVQGTQTDPTEIFQLAVNRQGVIRGSMYNTITNATLAVHGAVNKYTQRAAWTVGANTTTVFDTGLSNLTKDQAPALVHFGKDKTQEWLMVRLKSDGQKASDS